MAIGGVVINFTARTRDAVKEVGRLTSELGGLNKKADRVGGSLKKGLAVGAAAVGGALLTAGGAALEFAKAASEDAAEAEVLRKTLEKIPGVTQQMIDANSAWIDSMEIATGVADSDLRQAVSKLVLATGDLTEAQKLTALAADVAAGSGKNLDSVTQAIAKAVAGNTTALKRQFPWLDKNKDGTVDLDEALDGLAGAYGGAAEAAADQKPFERLDTVFGQIKEKLGEYLLPRLEDLSDWLKNPENQQKIDDWIAAVGSFAGAMDTLARRIGEVSSAFGTLFSPLTRAWNALPPWMQDWIRNGMPIVPGYGRVPSTSAPTRAPARAPDPGRISPANNDPRRNTGLPPSRQTGNVTINNYYPKPERSSDTTARDIRLGRRAGGWD